MSDKVDGYQQEIVGVAERLAIFMRATPVLTKTSAETVFRDIQKSQCGTAYASDKDLKELTSALKRENIAYSFSSIWISQAAIENADTGEVGRVPLAGQKSQRELRQSERIGPIALAASDVGLCIGTIWIESWRRC